MKDVVIIGSGIGGLCTAVRLLKQGFNVIILEKESTIGGKVNVKEAQGFRFDLTASILMTPDIYSEVFEYAGRDYRNYFEFIKLDPIYNVNYYDGVQFYAYEDLDKMKYELNKLENESVSFKINYADSKSKKCRNHFNSSLFEQYKEFQNKSLRKYLITQRKLLCRPMINFRELLNKEVLKSLNKIRPIKTSDRYICKIINNHKFRDYLLFLTMYIGVNPYESSNIYTMIPAITHNYGVSYIKGGVYEYISALVKLIYEMGGKIETNTEAQQIIVKHDRVTAVKTEDLIYISDIVVCNADYPYAVRNLFHESIEKKLERENIVKMKESSCSIFIIYLGLNRKFNDLNVHNIYISSEFKKSIEQAFKGEIPERPSVYIYYPSAVDDTLCSKGKSVMNIMVRVPNLSYENITWNKEDITGLRNKVIDEIKNIKGLEEIEKYIEYEDYLVPEDLEKVFNAYEGSAFGLSHKLNQSLVFRPSIKEKMIDGLYFIGSSTHPGNGVSIIIDGTKVVVDIICKDYV
ncbi:MAG TPA: phytoene desaturase [Clostridium sp.]|nr:phytoene desaturase [Clostridium sp.]